MQASSPPSYGSRSSGLLSNHDISMWLDVVAAPCLIWYLFITLVCALGYTQLRRYYSSQPSPSISSNFPDPSKTPHVTIIRPVKGLEPRLYECLTSTFRQDYPYTHLTIYLCVSSRDDPAYPVLQRVIADFPTFNAKILVEDEDPALQEDGGKGKETLGPNPKIRNMSHAYREAKGDIVWIIDCNVWVSKGVCGRMVDRLCGFSKAGQVMPYKFVHHLPLVVDVEDAISNEENTPLLQNGHVGDVPTLGQSTPNKDTSSLSNLMATSGGRLEELFLSSSHAKFYTAINTVLIAPCIVGKSNMFRRSHLNHLTSPSPSPFCPPTNPTSGIDHFSHNICEDHLIGDLLWRSRTPLPLSPDPALPAPPPNLGIGNHALLFGDLAIQPMANMSLPAYIARRVRWLRVRKFTVTLATLVEPGTESFLCSAYGAFGLTSLPWCHTHLRVPQTWPAFLTIWLASVSIWCAVDWTLYILLHSGASLELDGYTPSFVRPPPRGKGMTTRRPFGQWLLAWLGRETLALPIWAWAVWGGVGVEWRGRRFWVGMDMRVHEIEEKGLLQRGGAPRRDGGSSTGTISGGARGGRRKKRS